MATTPRRDFISARREYGGGGDSAQDQIRKTNTLARHANATTVQATTGMSAPFSARDMSPSAIDARAGTGGETSDERWARLFPKNPDGSPRINVRAGTSTPNGPAQTSPPPTITPSAPVQSTPTYVDPSLPAPAVNDAGIQRMNPTEQEAARTQLYQTHPQIFDGPDNPDRQAFVAHAKQYGEQSAHDNIDKILPNSANPAAPATPSVAQNKIDPYQFAQD